MTLKQAKEVLQQVEIIGITRNEPITIEQVNEAKRIVLDAIEDCE